MAVICQVITRYNTSQCVHQGLIELSFYRGEEETTKNVIVIVHKLQVRFIRGVFASLRYNAVECRDHPGLSYINQLTCLVNTSHSYSHS